jgi:hypothetical protein
MRLTAAISLIVLVVFSLFGSTILFQWEKSKIRQNVKTRLKEGVPSHELHVFSFSFAEWDHLEKKEGEKEIIINREYYDVVRKNTSADSIHVEAIHDKEEKVLFAKLEQEIGAQWQTVPKRDSPAKQLADFFKISCLPIQGALTYHSSDSFIGHMTPYSKVYEFILHTAIDKPPSTCYPYLG